jgi:hypothetical protein
MSSKRHLEDSNTASLCGCIMVMYRGHGAGRLTLQPALLAAHVLMVCTTLLLCCCSDVIAVDAAPCACGQHLPALSDLYVAMDGEGSWVKKWNFSNSEAPCGFHGVACANGAITEIILSNNNLYGTLPSSLSTLGSGLLNFVVSSNPIHGTLPDSFRNWTQILNFTALDTHINGSLPAAYSNWSAILFFSVRETKISGFLPPEYGSGWRLTIVSFSIAQCLGIIGSLPPSYGAWKSIVTFEAPTTGLTGSLPVEYSQWTTIQITDFSNLDQCGNLSGTVATNFTTGWKTIKMFSLR